MQEAKCFLWYHSDAKVTLDTNTRYSYLSATTVMPSDGAVTVSALVVVTAAVSIPTTAAVIAALERAAIMI